MHYIETPDWVETLNSNALVGLLPFQAVVHFGVLYAENPVREKSEISVSGNQNVQNHIGIVPTRRVVRDSTGQKACLSN